MDWGSLDSMNWGSPIHDILSRAVCNQGERTLWTAKRTSWTGGAQIRGSTLWTAGAQIRGSMLYRLGERTSRTGGAALNELGEHFLPGEPCCLLGSMCASTHSSWDHCKSIKNRGTSQ